MAATAATVLLKAADLIEANKLTVFNVVHVLRHAAAEMTVFGPAAYQLADAAARLLARHLRYTPERAHRDLARWSTIRTPDQIITELRRAATQPPAFADLQPGVLARIPRVHARPGEQPPPVVRIESMPQACGDGPCQDVRVTARNPETGRPHFYHRPPEFEVEIVSPATIKESA